MRVRMAEMVSVQGDAHARRPADNVVPFARPQTGNGRAPAVSIDQAARPMPPASTSRAQLTLFVGVSLALHAGAFAAFQREAPPLASVGVESISVELVLGTDRLAGRSLKPVVAESTVDAMTSKGEAPQWVKPETARAEARVAETAPRAKVETAAEVIPQPRPQAATEAKPVERQRAAAAAPVLATAAPSAEAATPLPEPEQPITKAPSVVAALPDAAVEMPRPRPEPPRVNAKPPEVRDLTERPKRRTAVRRKDAKGDDERTRESTSSMASVAASGIGRGRSDETSNYLGIVRAQLVRHKHYPPLSQRNGEQGRAVVSFAIEANGSVSRITLVQSSGVPRLDEEARASVRRAAPFPPPPSGRRVSYRVPITFDIR